MCQFLSALVVRNGDVLSHPMLDSHSDLVKYFKLPDTDVHIQHFAKVELVPGDNWLDPSTWAWKVDEAVLPVWWSDEIDHAAQDTLRRRAAAMILNDGEHVLIVDGCWIVGGAANVSDVRGGRIVRVQGSAQITDVWDSAQITNVWDSAQITNVRGSAQITNVRDSAQITHVGGSAQITDVGDSAQITNVGGSARITDVGGSARITNVRDSAQITNVWGSAQITNVRGGTLDVSAKARVIATEDK